MVRIREADDRRAVVSERPPYRIPTLAEIRAVRPNGRIVVSTFSGAGGSCLGFRTAGFRIVYANEFVEAARATYLANAEPGTVLDDRDIRQVSGDSIRELSGIGDREIDVLEGSPPCASFSTAGRRQEHWGREKAYSDTRQRADDLFDEYVRLVRELRPRAFVAENVSGLVKGVAKGYYIEIMRALRESDYQVSSRLLDAQWLGVPQARVRLLIVGTRNDLALDPAAAFPAPLPYRYSVRDALPEIDASVRTRAGERSIDEPVPTILTHGRRKTNNELLIIERMPRDYVPESANEAPSLDGYALGTEWNRLVPGEQSERYLSLVRPSADEPLPTVTASGGGSVGVPGGYASVTHPLEPRKFTIDELRRLSGFPSDFVLTGTYAQQWERIGRAVPPPMMAALARGVLSVLGGPTA